MKQAKRLLFSLICLVSIFSTYGCAGNGAGLTATPEVVIAKSLGGIYEQRLDGATVGGNEYWAIYVVWSDGESRPYSGEITFEGESPKMLPIQSMSWYGNPGEHKGSYTVSAFGKSWDGEFTLHTTDNP